MKVLNKEVVEIDDLSVIWENDNLYVINDLEKLNMSFFLGMLFYFFFKYLCWMLG